MIHGMDYTGWDLLHKLRSHPYRHSGSLRITNAAQSGQIWHGCDGRGCVGVEISPHRSNKRAATAEHTARFVGTR
jgi:hypothetical protein